MRTPFHTGHEPNPDGSVTLSVRAIKAVRTLVYGDLEDKSPTLKALDRAFGEAECNEQDREAVLHILGLKD